MADAETHLKVLMLAALGGDAASYRVLLADTGAHLRSYYARRLGREAADIEDLVQETLIAMHTRRATYDRTQPLTPWIYAIARYKLIDHLRKRDRHKTLPLDGVDALFAPPETEDAIARRDVDRLLQKLPERTQQLVRSVKVEGLSTQEAAARSGMSESAVKVAVHRALRSLSAMLGKETGGETDDLIARLADEPIEARSVAATLTLGMGAGALVSFAAMLLWLHLRPDLATAIFTGPFWMKLIYAASLAGLAFPVVARLARPVGTAQRSDLFLLLPVLLLAAVAAYELSMADTHAARMHLMMGASSNVCPWRIIALSMPVFAGVAIAMRALAPTRLALAGAAAGLLAGAVGTVIYALHCDESAAPFVVIWYTFGMTMVGLLGGLFGRALLRWR